MFCDGKIGKDSERTRKGLGKDFFLIFVKRHDCIIIIIMLHL